MNRSIENDHDEETERLKNSFEQKVTVMRVVSFVICYSCNCFYILDLRLFVGEGSPGATPLYGLYRYVQPQRVWFFSRFGHR